MVVFFGDFLPNSQKIHKKIHFPLLFLRFSTPIPEARFEGGLPRGDAGEMENEWWVLLSGYKHMHTHILIIYIHTWATAFIYNDEDKMWRQAGFVEMLVSPAKRDQNEMGGLQKRGRFKAFKTILKRGNSWWKRDHSWWKSAETWKARLKRGGGTPWIFFTAATS